MEKKEKGEIARIQFSDLIELCKIHEEEIAKRKEKERLEYASRREVFEKNKERWIGEYLKETYDVNFLE